MDYWILITKKERWYSGNDGYEDDLKIHYKYDSNVQNHKHVKQGDIVFIRDQVELKGIAKIVSIHTESGFKKGMKCPDCKSSEVYERSTSAYKYRCKKCGEEFDTPIIIDRAVVNFTASYGNSFHNAPQIKYKVLKKYQLTDSTQLAINSFDANRFIKEMEPNYPSLFTIFNFIKSNETHLSPYISFPDFDLQELYKLDDDDSRIRTLRSICERRGQQVFRNKLIDKYGSQCLITGCSELTVLEAAHIHPYKGDNDNHPGNGLLLRSDMHLLFDQNLIGIEPESLKIIISKVVKDSNYRVLSGCTLHITIFKPSLDALNYRWDIFNKVQKDVYGIY